MKVSDIVFGEDYAHRIDKHNVRRVRAIRTERRESPRWVDKTDPMVLVQWVDHLEPYGEPFWIRPGTVTCPWGDYEKVLDKRDADAQALRRQVSRCNRVLLQAGFQARAGADHNGHDLILTLRGRDIEHLLSLLPKEGE